jgi:hypothetical protein
MGEDYSTLYIILPTISILCETKPTHDASGPRVLMYTLVL